MSGRMAATVKVCDFPRSFSFIWLIVPCASLTVGSAVGSIGDLFAKVKAIDAKHGKFDFVLCTGDFFGVNSTDENHVQDDAKKLLAGDLEGETTAYSHKRAQLIPCKAPIECYIMQGEHPLPENVVEKFAKTGGELCKNVFLLSEYSNIRPCTQPFSHCNRQVRDYHYCKRTPHCMPRGDI